MPTPTERASARLRRELVRAQNCMREVASVLDHNNIGRCKFRLIRCADRAETVLNDIEASL